MPGSAQSFFKQKIINDWNLWLLSTVPISLAVIAMMMAMDFSRAQDISGMIEFPVRCSVPWLYLAFGFRPVAWKKKRWFSKRVSV